MIITGRTDELNTDTVMVYRWYWFERHSYEWGPGYKLVQCVRLATEFCPRIIGVWHVKKFKK